MQNQVSKSDSEWKESLTPEQYHIARQKGTEPAFSGKYYLSKEKGVYCCAACNNPLFHSNDKFESGSGWPSFVQPITGSIVTEIDTSHGMTRTEVLCANCGAHLGHVFPDGPKDKGGQRYCINSTILNLKKE
ncbi:MAG: peptide-methionine (R)-S-oxide reductase MsrB [Patescibacteria group bacterium]